MEKAYYIGIDPGASGGIAVLSENGEVADFVMNDKCAAGTGRFLEAMARTLEVSIDELGPISLKSKHTVEISSMCTVFAETEATTLMARGVSQANIALGLHKAVAGRTLAMLGRVGLTPPVVFVGGVAHNPCLVRLVAEAVGGEVLVPEAPDMTGALGAALWLAAETA